MTESVATYSHCRSVGLSIVKSFVTTRFTIQAELLYRLTYHLLIEKLIHVSSKLVYKYWGLMRGN